MCASSRTLTPVAPAEPPPPSQARRRGCASRATSRPARRGTSPPSSTPRCGHGRRAPGGERPPLAGGTGTHSSPAALSGRPSLLADSLYQRHPAASGQPPRPATTAAAAALRAALAPPFPKAHWAREKPASTHPVAGQAARAALAPPSAQARFGPPLHAAPAAAQVILALARAAATSVGRVGTCALPPTPWPSPTPHNPH